MPSTRLLFALISLLFCPGSGHCRNWVAATSSRPSPPAFAQPPPHNRITSTSASSPNLWSRVSEQPCFRVSTRWWKYWIVKSVFKALKKYWIWAKCTYSIEKVWKFQIPPFVCSNVVLYRWWQFFGCFLHSVPWVKFSKSEAKWLNGGIKVSQFSIEKVLKGVENGFWKRAGTLVFMVQCIASDTICGSNACAYLPTVQSLMFLSFLWPQANINTLFAPPNWDIKVERKRFTLRRWCL